MKSNSKYPLSNARRLLKSGKVWLVLIGLSAFAGACITLGHVQKGKPDRGIAFTHAKHAERGLDCSVCHAPEGEDGARLTMPTHEVCGTCHDIPEEWTDTTTCKLCHTREDLSLDERKPALDAEKIFSHTPHLNKEIACDTCHKNPDKSVLPAGPVMKACMDCHGQTRASLNECAVCHKTITEETRPTHRSGARIAHDAPQIWEHVHGQESRVDPAYCALCHNKETSCDDCHRKSPPSSHTVSWRRKTHGLRATWDRSKCAVCHEEDSCMKCHKNTEPSSHRGGWDSPANLHCVSCHYPPERTNCTVCHEEINHERAMPSPHGIGLFPTPCGLCHPGGLPNRAPHVQNSTVRCVVCHK